MFSDYFFLFPQSFLVSVFLTCSSVIHSFWHAEGSCLTLSHTHALTRTHILYLILTSCTLPYSCAVWHWAIRILKCKATNGRLLMLSTNTSHTPAPNLFISVKICVHVCMWVHDVRFMVPTKSHDKETHIHTHSQTNSKNYLPMAVKEASCVTVQWLGQGQWYNCFI